MGTQPFESPGIDRAGTSQIDRVSAALDPGYVQIDERTIEDLIEFTRAYAQDLRYFGLDDQDAGDWSGFIPAELPSVEVADFAANPERYTPGGAPLLFRPHFTLFIAFLRLMERAQAELNDLTGRHLDFYYRDVLRMTTKPAVPDQVNVLVDPPPNGRQGVMLPAATPLAASPDSLGRERTYATDRDLFVTQAQIERLSSVRVEREVTGLKEAREPYRDSAGRAALGVFQIALGRPEPGGPLPLYPDSSGTTVDAQLLLDRGGLVAFSERELHLKLFELRDVMTLKRSREGAVADQEWFEINAYLEQVAQAAGHALEIEDPRAFEHNFAAALGGEMPSFAEIPEVDTIYDLYEFRSRDRVKQAIRDELHFADVDDFAEMMHIKVGIDNEWREINRLLEQAGRRAKDNAGYELNSRPSFDPTAFDENLAAAVGDVTFPGAAGDIEAYYDAILAIENYFSMTAEEFLYVMGAAAGKGDWAKADQILTAAYRQLFHRDRRAQLRDVREAKGIDAMLCCVLGESSTAGKDRGLLRRVKPYLGSPSDHDVLAAAYSDEAAVDWPHVYSIAEIAQRNRERLPEPVPAREEWINLHPAEDATAAKVLVGSQGELARWATFGVTPTDPKEEEAAPTPLLGWALTSPLLDLAEGRRSIELTLGFAGEPEQPQILADAIAFQLSTEKGWVDVEPVPPPDDPRPGELGAAEFGSYGELSGTGVEDDSLENDGLETGDLRAVRFRLEVDEQVDAITALPADGPGIGSQWPVLRLVFREEWNKRKSRHVMQYPAVGRLRLGAVHVRVGVAALAALQLRNDDSTLDPSGPFEPFTTTPAVGSRLLIGHPELATKRLDTVQFRYEWMGVPADLTSGYYKNYPLEEVPVFAADIKLVDRRVEVSLVAAETGADLFSGAGQERSIAVDDVSAAFGSRPYERLVAASTEGDLSAWDRYLLWELRPPDFQHGVYARVASQKAVEMAAAIANDDAIDPADYQVNPPYTPRMKVLVVDYSSSTEIRLDQDQPAESVDQLIHLHPFGFSAITSAGTSVPLMPQYENEGELYIGLRDVHPPEKVSFLFQMSEGSADPDLDPATVRWSYASGGEWLTLDDGAVLYDGTRGLINSGIVEMLLPEAKPPTILPGDLYWIRAAVARNSTSVAGTVAIHTQGVSATFVDNDNATDHYSRPLPAESITKSAAKVPGISGIRQPYTSQGGRMAEDEGLFATRVSERLRHKHRALSMWDFERLVLERFPQIYKAKCIPVDLSKPGATPGMVDIVVIPDIRKKLPFNSFEPKASPELLAAIEEHLGSLAPMWARISVRNAHFIVVRARFSVRFSTVGSDDYYRQLLIDELDRFLSPWAYDDGADIIIGSRIYASSLVNFIDRRPYVDYVADLELFYSEDGDYYEPAPPDDGTGYHVAAGRADGVLRASREHVVDLIAESGYQAEVKTGIGFMKVELDLKIAGSAARPPVGAGIGSRRVGIDLMVAG